MQLLKNDKITVIGTLNPISSVSKRKINGFNYLEMEHDLKGLGTVLKTEQYINAPTPKGMQLFKILKIDTVDEKTLRITAMHRMYDLTNNYIRDTNIVGKNRVQAIKQVLDNTTNPHTFTVEGSSTAADNLRIVGYTPFFALMGNKDNTVINRFGGEFDFDNDKIIVGDEIGRDNGYLIMHNKNMIELNESEDFTGVITKMIPKSRDGIYLDELYVESTFINAYEEIYLKEIEFDIFVSDDKENPKTEAQVKAELKQLAREYYLEQKCDIPRISYTIPIEDVKNKPQYKDIKFLYDLDLGDYVTVRKNSGLKIKIRLKEYIYDNVKEEFVQVTLNNTEDKYSLISQDIITNISNKINLEINNIRANSIDVKDLNATNATIENLTVKVAKIDSLLAGNITGEHIQAGGITSDKLTIQNGFITNLMVSSLDVSKLNAGTISTSKFIIKSDDGGIEIVGATQQFKDKNNRVRIQMGKDAHGNFNFILRGEDGTTALIDHTGIKKEGIANDLIVSDMIAGDAIGEKQIDYNSFSEGFNKDTNTTTIKGTKIKLDNQNQTLDIAFNQLKTQADGTKSLTESNSTTIGIQQGQISTAINNTQIVKDGQTILLKDDYNRTVATVNSINSTIGSHTSSINELTGKIVSVDTKVNSVKRDLDGTISTVSGHTSNITGLNSSVSTHTNQISQLKGEISLKVEQTDINTAKREAVTEAVGVKDRRSNNDNPSYYYNAYPSRSVNEFKLANILGIPGAGSVFGNCLTMNPWADSSGGYPVQTFTSNSTATFERKGISETDWGEWKQVEDITGSQNKANIAQNNAVTITEQKITQARAEIKIETDKITQSVSSIDTKVTTVTTTANDALGQIEGLEIGGRNLIQKSNDIRTLSNNTGLGEAHKVTSETIPYWKVEALTSISTYEAPIWDYMFNNCIRGNQYTISCDIRVFSSTQVGFYNSRGMQNVPVNTWVRISHSFTYNEVRMAGHTHNGVQLDYRNWKLEKGNKATDWTLATEDIEESFKEHTLQITEVKNKTATLETNINSITGRVTAIDNKVITIDGNIIAVDNRLRTAEHKITVDAITNVIKSSQTDGKNTFAQTSTVEQLVNKITFDFSSSGGYNLLRNGQFLNGTSFYWEHSYNYNGQNRSIGVIHENNEWCLNGRSCLQLRSTNATTGTYGVGQTIRLKAGTTYTISGFVAAHRCTPIVFVQRAGGDWWTPVFEGQPIMSGGKDGGNWHKFSYTFATDHNGLQDWNFHYEVSNSDNDGYCWFTDLQTEEGMIKTAYSQHQNEIYSGNTSIDASGVIINNGAITVKNKAGQNVLQGDSNGNLTITGRINPSDNQIRLFGDECKIDGSGDAVRLQKDGQNYISVDYNGARFFNRFSNNGTRYISVVTEYDGHGHLYNAASRIKMLGATSWIQCRNGGDNAYVPISSNNFDVSSKREYKDNITDPVVNCLSILKNSKIKQYNYKSELEDIAKTPTVLLPNGDNPIEADTQLGFILEDLDEASYKVLHTRGGAGISLYPMISVVWKACQEQQQVIEQQAEQLKEQQLTIENLIKKVEQLQLA